MLWLPQCNKVQIKLLVLLGVLPGFNPVWFGTLKIAAFPPSRKQQAQPEPRDALAGPTLHTHTSSCAHFFAHAFLALPFVICNIFFIIFVEISPLSHYKPTAKTQG